MQGVVPMSDQMDYKYKYTQQYDQPIMITLSGQLSAKLSESINNLHSSKDAYERFVSDSKRVGINIPFVSNKSRKSIQSHSSDLKWNNSSHIPQREHENLRKTPQREKTGSIQPSRLNSQNKRDSTSYRHDLNNTIRKRGGAIPKDNIRNEYSRKTELNRYSPNGDRENSRDNQRNGNFFRQNFEPLRDGGILNNEEKMVRQGNQSDLMPSLKLGGSRCVSEDQDGLEVKPEQSSCYGSSLSFNNRIYDHDKTMNKVDRNNNNDSGKIIDELYLNKARNDSSKIIDTKNDLTETASYNTNKVSFCSAIANTPHRSMSLGGIASRNSTEYDRLQHNYHFARGGGYNPKIDNKEINDLDDENTLIQAYSGIIRKTICEIPETGTLSENKYYSTSNLNNYNTSTADVRRSSPMFIDDYILVNRATGLNAAMSNAEMVPDHDLYTDSFESASSSESKEKDKRECAAKRFLEDQNLPAENPDQVDNTEQKKDKNVDHCEECTCKICVCGDCNCKICECEKGVKEEYERMKKEKEIDEEKAKYCTCYICECNECNCIKCECDIDKFPQGIPLSMVVCPCTNCNCGIPCKEGTLLKASKFFLTRDNDLFKIPDNVNQDMKVKILNAVQNVNVDIKFAIKNANLQVEEAMNVADKMVQDAVLQLCKMDIEAVTGDNTSFTEAKGAIDDSDGNKGNQESSNQQPPNPPPNANDRKKSTSKKGNCDCPYPCKCEDCPDQPHEPPACDCPEPCECVGCPTLNIPVKIPHCRCKTCLCDPCLDKNRKKGSPIEKFLCGCKPECICEKCPAKPGCECEGECVCAVCPHRERKCDCAICLCNDCAAFKQVQQLCECPQCLCNVCEKGGGVIPTKPPKLIYNVKCKCAVCLCDNCASDKIQATCSCPICLCDKCPEMEGKPAFECSCYPQCTCDKCSDPNVKCVSKRQKEEPYKCTCSICYCEKCSDPTKERQDPCGEEHPKDCTCLKCTCSPCLSKKQKLTECKCEKCKCNPCKMVGGMLPDCKCDGECKCINCQYKTANIDECTCKTCECNKKILCTTGAASNGDEIRKIELSECTCEPCNCNPCLAQGGHPPKCKCPKCMCTKCEIKQLPTCDEGVHPPDCKCNICYCAPCKYDTDPNCDKTFRLSCTCEVCSCKPCKAKGDSCEDDDIKKLTIPRSCKCIKCECFPCILPRNAYQGVGIDKNLPTCLCGDCTCNPCMAAPPDICNEPREPLKYVPDCTCPECFCDPCSGKEPVNPCDLMKIDTTVVCTCSPKCDCNPCTLPPAVDPREAKPDHPETCKCVICVCTQCELSKKILQPLTFDHSDDCQCSACLCKPCKLKPDHNETRLDKINQGPECKCKVCCCSPCKLQTSKCHEYYSNRPDCVCTVCSCDPCKAKPKNCETCPECFGKGDCKCIHCECVPCTKTQPQFCNCELCRCTNCLPLATKKFIPNCNCLLCLCKQPEQDPTNQLSICQTEDDETKKCPVICPMNTIHKKTGTKRCSCSICYCDPCQPVVTGTKFEYTFKPPENNPLEGTLKVNEQKKCLCEPCLCKTCPKKMDKTKCSCYICKCENCSFKQNEENDLTCRCSRPCPCISCKGRGGAGSGNITTENIDHVRGGATTSNSEIKSVEEIGGETKCSCADPCVCQSCAETKSDKRNYEEDKTPCACTTPCVSTCLHSSHQTNHTINVPETQSKTDECNIVKKLANQISSLIAKPFQTSNISSHPSAVSTAINNLLNCDCPIPCLCPDRDQCGTYQFMNTAEKDTPTKRSNIMGKISSNKTQLHSKTQLQTKKRCNCVGMCRCSIPQIGLTPKQAVSDSSKYPSNRNSPTDTRVSNQKKSSTIYQPKKTCDCVGSCKCSIQQFDSNQKPSVDITKRISANFKQINDISKKQIDKIISSSSQNTQFRIFETRKLTEDSLLIKWTPANLPCLTGYEVEVNGSLSHRVRNKDRCVAVLFNICYDKPVNISVFAMSRENRNHPPAIITVC
ncbi:uncharacterized protein LOC123295981 [Chrysoperla carnea]|uniref:uncharacterized protein LOC123295981 n=1 Tax=Chrysoperla carnea TaxID=189513 RepID=UPI001D0937F1|nr:uncharacterized protein LOC123295981 [Chrysoperla carnea]